MGNKALIFLLTLICLGTWSEAQATEALRVAVFSRVVADLAAQVGGGRLTVECLLPADSDPHTFSPRPADLKKVGSAQLVVLSGGALDAAWEKFVPASGFRGKVLDLGKTFPEAARDPHWWHSIAATRRAVEALGNTLAQEQPSDASFFRERVSRCDAKLLALDVWARRELARVPADQRMLITAHDALGWFGKEFGFETHALSGSADHEEPSSRHVASLVAFMHEKKVRAVFAEYGESSKLMEALARSAGVRVAGPLYLDGLGPGPEATYESMMRHNVSAFVEGLNNH